MLSSLNGMAYEGYEIHMGRSQEAMNPLTGNGNVYGSYIHGIFDAPGAADKVLETLCSRKGIDFNALGTFDMKSYKNSNTTNWPMPSGKDWKWSLSIGS